MAKKRNKRRKMSIASAVIRFLIGMLLIALIVSAGFYLLFEVDYSRHLINSDGTYASTRAYVLPADGSATAKPDAAISDADADDDETAKPEATQKASKKKKTKATATPKPTKSAKAKAKTKAKATAKVTAEPTPEPLIIINTLAPTPTPDATPEPTAEPTATPEPTAEPTPVPTPVPTATPEPTPEPEGTQIPSEAFSSFRSDLKTPKTYDGQANVGISRCYVSRLNYYQVMQINGWGYIDIPEFNGLTSTTYALVTAKGEDEGRVYLCTPREGASRRIHEPQAAENVNDADFEVTIDTSEFTTGEYELQLILQYEIEKDTATPKPGKKEKKTKTQVWLCPFSKPHTFTVVDGEIVSPILID